MNPDSKEMPATTTANPIGAFTDCHLGIIRHLDQMGALPKLAESARQARAIASETVAFFDDAIFQHHEEEERELIPAVRRAAQKGEERADVDRKAERLIAEHRDLEAQWNRIKPQLMKLAAGKEVEFSPNALLQLIEGYKAHASFEETEFLPLAQEILGRDSPDLAALGYALHIRHARKNVAPYT